jgi:predicted secreted acid phosphatase
MQFTTHTQDMWGDKFIVLPNPRNCDWVNATNNWSFASDAAAQDKVRKDLLERWDYQP